MDKKSKLVYVTPDQQQWLTEMMVNVLESNLRSFVVSTNDKIAASAILKKLQGRKEKSNDSGRFTV